MTRLLRPPGNFNALSSPDRAGWAATHRHRKGGLYRVLGRGTQEADRSAVVIYDDENGEIWVRPAREFDDGRFERVAPVEG